METEQICLRCLYPQRLVNSKVVRLSGIPLSGTLLLRSPKKYFFLWSMNFILRTHDTEPDSLWRWWLLTFQDPSPLQHNIAEQSPLPVTDSLISEEGSARSR